MLTPAEFRAAFWLSLTLIGMSACGVSVAVGPPAVPSATEAAFIETIVGQTSRSQPGIQRAKVFAAADGSTIACGEWTAPDGWGTTDWSPFYVRWRGGTVLRVHLDDPTGFGPALQGCNMALAGQIKLSG